MREFVSGNNVVMIDEEHGTMFSSSSAKITRPKQNEMHQTNIENIAYWGEGNDFP
jgi:hypothetical protein